MNARHDQMQSRSAVEIKGRGFHSREAVANLKELHMQAYGEFVRLVCVHRSALEAGATLAEASFSQWFSHHAKEPENLTPEDLLTQRGPGRLHGDYGLLTEFKDEKLALIASCAGDEDFASVQRCRLARASATFLVQRTPSLVDLSHAQTL